MAKSKNTITVEQIGSPIGRPADQRTTLKNLGLNKCLTALSVSPKT